MARQFGGIPIVRFGHAHLAEMLREAQAAAAAVADLVDTSAALSSYQATNDADEVSLAQP